MSQRLAAICRMQTFCDFSMPSQILADPTTLESLINRILFSAEITRAEQDWLSMVAAFKDTLGEDDRVLLDRVFYGIRHGLLQVVD